MTGFVLERNHFDKVVTIGAKAYYEEGTHTVDKIYNINEEYKTYDDYSIDNIIMYDNFFKVTYINTEDVVDIVDGTEFGMPISILNKDYVSASKRLYLK